MPASQPDKEERYVSLSHIVPAEHGEPMDGSADSLRVFSIPTAELTIIEPTGEVERVVYYGILHTLQGPPKTRAEVIGSLGLTNETDIKFAEVVFDALSDMAFISSVNGLARVFSRTWQNPSVYPSVGYNSPEQADADRRPYQVPRGQQSVPFEVEPTYERATTRVFDRDAPLDLADLQKILINSYRTTPDAKRPLPSPGGIYPVTIHVVNHGNRVTTGRGDDVLPEGVYQYDPLGFSLEQRARFGSAGESIVEFLTSDPDATDPAVWLMLGINMRAFEQKYGNASQVFLGICIGSAMQRLVEEAEDAGYGTLPLFGIQHHYADQILENGQDVNSVLAIGLGRPYRGVEAQQQRKAEIAAWFDAARVGTESLITGAGRLDLGYYETTGIPIDFVCAWSQYGQLLSDGSTIPSRSFGTAATYEEAQLKATAEAVERIMSWNVRVDWSMAAARELGARYIDPRQAAPFDSEQQRQLRIQPFTPETAINWTAGTAVVSGERVYAPSSMIYYPYIGTEADVVSNVASSGVAAHFDRNEAVQRGFMELIERDAIMHTWIEQRSPSLVAHEDLPEAVAHRVQQLANAGRQVDVLNMTQDNGVPSFMVTIRSDQFPHFYAGAAANLDPERAIHKAFEEAVAGVASRVLLESSVREAEAKRREQGRFSTESHAMLYAEDPALTATLNWLYSGERSIAPANMQVPPLTELITQYDPVVFDLDNSAPGNQLRVVRVVAPDLIPITFGRPGVSYLHPSLPEGTKAPEHPHFFA